MKPRSKISAFISFMKISLFQLIILSVTLSMASATALSGQELLKKRLTLEIQNKTFEEALALIEEKTDVRFLYLSGIIDNRERVNLNAQNEQLLTVLKRLCEPQGLKSELDGRHIILTKERSGAKNGFDNQNSSDLEGQKIKGVVLDNEGYPIPGATIMEKGTMNGTITDLNGNFDLTLNGSDKDAVLTFSFVGFKTQEIAVAGKVDISVEMELDIKALDEVVIVGYGTQKKADVIGSISSVKGSDLAVKSMANFDAGLQGMAAGVSVLSQSGKPGAPSSIKIRGANSISSGTEPLWIIDGMPINQEISNGVGSSGQNPMSLLNPNDIESIQVLKDAAATSIYGSRGSNGIILVTTKSGKGGKGYININVSSGISYATRTLEDVGYANTEEWFEVMDVAYQNSFERNFKMTDYYQFAPLAFDADYA